MQTETLIQNESSSARALGSRGLVLVVDDDEANRMLLRDTLEIHGYEIVEADNGEQALQKAGQRPPDLILLDVMMPQMDGFLPQMDGFEVCRRLKREARTAHIPVLIVTALSDQMERLMGTAAGASDFLTKPLDLRELTLRVHQVVHAKQLSDQLPAENLLLNTLPRPIAEQMKQGEVNIAEHHPDVSVPVVDLVSPPTTRGLPNHRPPANMQTESLIRNKSSSARALGCRGLVLVVDDDEANRMLLRDPLETHGYEIIEAENGEQALQEVEQRPPDVILLDVMMPQMDGFEVCRRLKKDARTAHIPILIVTALSERMERMMGIAAGASDFLTKPVDLQELTLRVNHAVHAKRLFDQLQAEQAKVENLLLNILPLPIAERMKQGEVNIAENHPDVSVLVADLVGFTTLAAHIGPDQVVHLLNEIFSGFDLLALKHGLEKIKTMGDAYMAAGGIPLPRPDHAEAIAELALDLMADIEKFNRAYNTSIQLRIGISTGSVVAGVIGRWKFTYDLWGDTVNVACRLESLGQAGSILVSDLTYERLKDKYRFGGSRSLDIKGRGAELVHTVLGRL
jgi:DNA-binding response OmpR family regulator